MCTGSWGFPPLMRCELNDLAQMQLLPFSRSHLISVSLLLFSGSALPWPCELGMRSRWEIKTAQECSNTPMGTSTMSTLVELLEEKALGDTNQLLRDIHMTSQQTCDSSDEFSLAMADAEIIIGNQCFKRVHPDHLTVYDFTYWTLEMTHPGKILGSSASLIALHC